ncbi:hypothetical protein AB0D98_16105 [Streptomyces sp. NPDC047987]|uniref:hypothetical protein n=1 Tax=unclassified Streptomyces TaxID=2593676 RepID=UPI0034303A08
MTEPGSFDDLMHLDAKGPGDFRRMYLVQSEQYRLDGSPSVPAQGNEATASLSTPTSRD